MSRGNKRNKKEERGVVRASTVRGLFAVANVDGEKILFYASLSPKYSSSVLLLVYLSNGN